MMVKTIAKKDVGMLGFRTFMSPGGKTVKGSAMFVSPQIHVEAQIPSVMVFRGAVLER